MGRRRHRVGEGAVSWTLVLCLGALCGVGMGLAGSPARAEERAPLPCGEDPAYAELDFWLGAWQVVVGDRDVGKNRIEKILDGCAVEESWTSAQGHPGRSLFYFLKATGEWKQVWVTTQAYAPGGVKEKTLVARLPDGGVRFQGRIPLVGGGDYLDRTTLTPLEGGRVRQLIEVSQDGGETWRSTFDAIYLPVESSTVP